MRMPIILFGFIALYILAACNQSPKQENTASTSTQAQAPAVPDEILKLGEKTFALSCASCHKDSLGSAVPSTAILSQMSSRAIFTALSKGKMVVQAKDLSDEQRKAVAQWITKKPMRETSFPATAFTKFDLTEEDVQASYNHSGWGGNLEGTGYRTAQQAGITPQNVSTLKLKWAFGFPDGTQVRSKPAVIGKWLIVGSEFGEVYALDKDTGLIGWVFSADAAVRGAISFTKGKELTAYFADYATNVYAIDVVTGTLKWKKRAGTHPQSSVTGSVVVNDGRVYVPITSFEVVSSANADFECCTSSGGVVALDAMNGNEVWRHRVIAEEAKISGKKKNGKSFYGPSGAPVWCSPTVDVKRQLLYIGTGENYTNPPTETSDAIQAIDLKTGKLKWNFQASSHDTWNLGCPDNPNCPEKIGPDLDFGMAPLLVKTPQGKDVLVVGQKSGVVHALDPDNGKLLWQKRIGKGGMLGGVHWGMATDGELVYAANSDHPYALDLRDSSVNAAPGVFGLKIQTGEIVWKTAPAPCDTATRKVCLPANSAAPLVIPGVVFAGDINGFVRAYSTIDGSVLWQFDTVREYDGVNGIKGNGGTIDGPSPLAADGMLFVNSGYGAFGQMPGNVLLAFTVK